MTMKGLTASSSTRPAPALMDLDVGRINPKEAMQIAGLAVASLFAATLGALLANIAAPDQFSSWSAWRLAIALFGWGVAILGAGLAVTLARLTYDDWVTYRRRLDEWHYAALDAYERAGGQTTEQTVSAWELTANSPLHVLALALAANQRVAAGQASAWSVRSLAGNVWLGAGGGRNVSLGELSPSQAEAVCKVFAQLGLVRGRGPRVAGEWAAQSADDVVRLVSENWVKVRPGAAEPVTIEG